MRELKFIGLKRENLDIVYHLLLSFLKSYDTLMTALETLEPEKLTLEFVKGKLLDQEMKQKTNGFKLFICRFPE